MAERCAAQLGYPRRNKVPEQASARNYFPNGVREARSAALLRKAIRNDFPFGMQQRSSGIQDETRYQNKLPLEFTRRAAQIYCTRPFEMTSHSECISLNGGFITHSQLPPNRKSFRITPKGPTGGPFGPRHSPRAPCPTSPSSHCPR